MAQASWTVGDLAQSSGLIWRKSCAVRDLIGKRPAPRVPAVGQLPFPAEFDLAAWVVKPQFIPRPTCRAPSAPPGHETTGADHAGAACRRPGQRTDDRPEAAAMAGVIAPLSHAAGGPRCPAAAAGDRMVLQPDRICSPEAMTR